MKPRFPKAPNALTVALLQSISTSTTVKNDLKSNAKSVTVYLTCIAVLSAKLNSGVPIATMRFTFGNIAVTALFPNVTMINALYLQTTSKNSIASKKLYVKQNLLSLNSATNTANITLPMSNFNILLPINPTLSSTFATQ